MKSKFTIYFIFFSVIVHNLGCSKYDSMPEPEISFSYTIGENGDVVFINESKNVKEYLWDFGDGESSSQVSPEHNFFINKTYIVTLTGWSENKKSIFSKEVVIENSNDLVDNSKYQSMFPYTGVFSKPLSVETSGAGIIRYEINDIKGATYPTESKPRISISENEISLAYWIDQKNEKYNIKERVYFAPKPIKSQISKKSILNISPKFISAHLIINNELINIFESYGNWKIFSFSKNRLNAEYDGLFRSDDGTNYKVKIKLENLFFSIEP